MTATEIVSAKQRLFSTVKEIQNTLERALEELLDIMNYWADFLPGVPAGGYRTDYRWDDSIVTDTTAEKAQFLQEIAAGVRQPWEFPRQTMVWTVKGRRSEKALPGADPGHGR